MWYLIKKSFHLVLGVGLQLVNCVYLLWVSVLLFVICICCVICLLHKGRSRAGQCDQNIRLTVIVGSNKVKMEKKAIKSMRIVNYTLETSLIASLTPSEAEPASTTMEFSYHQWYLHRRCAPRVNTCKMEYFL